MVGIIWVAIIPLIIILFIIVYYTIIHYNQVKCPFCGNWQEDSSYSRQDCDKCREEWHEAQNEN